MESYVIQTVMGIIGSVGFAVLFGIYDRKLLWIAVGGGAGWAVYLVCVAGDADPGDSGRRLVLYHVLSRAGRLR